MAPEKIFIDEDLIAFHILQTRHDWDIEYLRKDALLEKIDDAIAHLSDGSLAGYYESLAYKDIRELIESM